MKSEEFVKAVKVQASDAAADGIVKLLEHPPGRKPDERLLALSKWYNQLPSNDRTMVVMALREAAEMAVFEFFCVLDGVCAIEDGRDKGELEVDFVKSGVRMRLNDPQQEELHNLFNALLTKGKEDREKSGTNPYDQDEAGRLKAKLKSGDNLDLHHVPDKHASIETISGYDPNRAPAVALPKAEHRQMPPQRRN